MGVERVYKSEVGGVRGRGRPRMRLRDGMRGIVKQQPGLARDRADWCNVVYGQGRNNH